MRDRLHFFDGERVSSSSLKWLAKPNHSRRQVINGMRRGCARDIHIAVEKVREVFPIWCSTAPAERARRRHRENEFLDVDSHTLNVGLSKSVVVFDLALPRRQPPFHFNLENSPALASGILGTLGFELGNPYPLCQQKTFFVPKIVPDRYLEKIEKIHIWDGWDPDHGCRSLDMDFMEG